jgi:hypothetical protein
MMLGSSIYVKINSKMIAILLHFDYYHEVCAVHLSHVAAWILLKRSILLYLIIHKHQDRNISLSSIVVG